MTIQSQSYISIVADIKEQIIKAQYSAVQAVNSELVLLYWNIGTIINAQKEWGNKFIDKLSADIKLEFPNMKGFSQRNLKYMTKFAETFQELQIVQEVLAQISWYHNITLLDKIKEKEQILWYAMQAKVNAWSRNVLVHQIELQLYQRQVSTEKLTNFNKKLPQIQGKLAEQLIKDPYIFDFLQLGNDFHERELEKALIQNISQFLLELGTGFAYIGRQYHLEVDGEDFYIDLLFYHLHLRCYIVIELKVDDFKPEYAGKLNFYLTAVDKQLKHEQDNPSIGLLLCKKKKKLIVEYSLMSVDNAIGVVEYTVTKSLPQVYNEKLPTIEELESRFSKTIEEIENHKKEK